jgi:type II secretory pathway pseudopilin PulG
MRIRSPDLCCAATGSMPVHKASNARLRRSAYVLLETVIATGLLIVALAVIGVQVQNSRLTIKEMQRETRALTLADQFLAEMDLGLIELTSLQNIEEGDFGPRHPDWGWRMTTEESSIVDLFVLKVEILFWMRDGRYQPDNFAHEEAEVIHTLYAVRAMPEQVNFAADFGMTDDEMREMTDRMAEAGMPNFDPLSFNLRDFMGNTPSEDLLQQLPILMDKFGFQLEDVASFVPPDMLQQLKDMGLFGAQGDENGEGGN